MHPQGGRRRRAGRARGGAAPGAQVGSVPSGLEAVIFTADGDMRQALNNLQATVAGFGLVDRENVFKVGQKVSLNSMLSASFRQNTRVL